MTSFTSKNWEKTLKKNNLKNFNEIWETKNNWFEPKNIRRNGWSGVITKKIGNQILFIKKQKNHFCHDLYNPIRGIPTFKREFNNIRKFNALNIKTPELIYFGEQQDMAVLVTKKISSNFVSLESFLKAKGSFNNNILKSLANHFYILHSNNMQHTHPAPKHIFISKKNEILFIDLEKAKKRLFRFMASSRDIYCFIKCSIDYLKPEEIKFFLKCYFKKHDKGLFEFLTMNKIKKLLKKRSLFI